MTAALAASLLFDPRSRAAEDAANDAPLMQESKERGQEVPAMASRGKPAILRVVPNAASISRYGKFELTVDLSASYENPFDPEQIDVIAEFKSPSGRTVAVPGFFYQAYRNKHEGDDSKSPVLDAFGTPCWKVRYTPTEAGAHAYVVRLRNRFRDIDARLASEPGGFVAVESKTPGFVRICPANRRCFQFDNGTPFFAVGQNLQNDWPVYKHSRLLAEAGANCARVWTFCHWTWLEWSFKRDIEWAGPGHWMRSYAGAGRYNQRIAWIADHHLEQWTRDGLWVMLCMGNATGNGEFSIGGKDRYDSWGGNPYNKVNGGFLDDPARFWTDEPAKKLYKQRLRYIVARYGYSPNIWAWEFWNELGEATPEMAAWHKELSEYLRTIDPNRHLITTSTWTWAPDGFAAVWDSKAMDFTQSHVYAPLSELGLRVNAHLTRWAGPHVVGEGGGPAPAVGSDDRRAECVVDPDGVDFHNSLWGAVMTGAAGTTLPWWWRGRIEPRNLFFHYRAIANFVRDVPWTTRSFRPIQARTISLVGTDAPRKLSPVIIVPCGPGWGSKTTRNKFAVGPDGTMACVEEFAKHLYGSGRKDWRNPPAIEVDFPVPGKFIVHVSETSHSILEVRLNGELALREEALNVPMKEIEKDFMVDVPAGHSVISLDNPGGDWIRIGYLLLTDYRDARRYPDLDVWGLQSGDMTLLWVRNRLNQWSFKAAGLDPAPVGPAAVTVGGFKDGRCRVEWWDTYKGVISRTDDAMVRGGAIELLLPPVQTDVACKITPAKE